MKPVYKRVLLKLSGEVLAGEKGSGIDLIKNFSNIGQLSNREYPLEINKYFNNLIRLGLIEKSQLSSLINKQLYEPLKTNEFIKPYTLTENFPNNHYKKATFKESYMELTDFGKSFCNICLNTTK